MVHDLEMIAYIADTYDIAAQSFADAVKQKMGKFIEKGYQNHMDLLEYRLAEFGDFVERVEPFSPQQDSDDPLGLNEGEEIVEDGVVRCPEVNQYIPDSECQGACEGCQVSVRAKGKGGQ